MADKGESRRKRGSSKDEVPSPAWLRSAVEEVDVVDAFVVASGYASLASPAHANEDRVVVRPGCYVDSKGCVASLFAILDGHGGVDVVDFVAQHLVAAVFAAEDTRVQDLAALDDAAVTDWLVARFAVLDAAVITHARQVKAWSGCCACVAVLFAGRLHVANLGDCRALLLASKKKGVFKASKPRVLSNDHQPLLERERARIEAHGGWIDANGRVLGVLACARSFGDREFKHAQDREALKREKGLDVLQKMRRMQEKQQQSMTLGRRIDVTQLRDPLLSAQPDIVSVAVDALGGVLLLATDGVWDYCSNSKAAKLLAKSHKAGIPWSDACTALCSYARTAETGDNSDDISALAVELRAPLSQ